jgi:hypothetical protein
MNPGEIIVNSAQPSNGSSNTADGLHPAKSQQPGATRSDFAGTWEAGSDQLQGIGPLYGRRFGPTSGPGGSSMELRGAARLPFHGHQPGQLGRMETASDRSAGHPQSLGNRVQAPTVRRSEPTTEKPRGHRNRPGPRRRERTSEGTEGTTGATDTHLPRSLLRSGLEYSASPSGEMPIVSVTRLYELVRLKRVIVVDIICLAGHCWQCDTGRIVLSAFRLQSNGGVVTT